MGNYKEIVTKTIILKNKKKVINNFTVTTEQVPNTILGCWIINNKYNGHNNNGVVNVVGSYDINIWYSYDNNKKTAVTNYTYNYNEELTLSEKVKSDDEIIVKSLKQPTVSNVTIKDGSVVIDVEKEIGIEVIGEALIKINVEEDNDDYIEIDDDIDNLDNIADIEDIETDYLD